MDQETEKDVAVAASTSRSSNGYLLLGFVLTFLPSPYCLAALIPLGVSAIGTVRTSRALHRLDAPRPLRISNTVSLALTVLLMATLAIPALLGAGSELQSCLDGANTKTAEQTCHDQHGDGGFWQSLFG